MDRRNGRNGADTWSIVLAGGKGERLRPLTERWLGRYVPKQYCTFVGQRSMLQHTLDRARLVSRPEAIVTIVAEEHRGHAERQIARDLSDNVWFQPTDRDTAAGIFLPLAHVRRQSPAATVAIFPADHFIHPERQFIDAVRAAMCAVDEAPDRLVLLGVQPEGMEQDYGWIVPGAPVARSVQAVRSFIEKPSAALAAAARVRGGLWNTMVMAVRAETLWQLGRRYLPEVVERFERWMESGSCAEALPSLYRAMPRRNFSSDLLQRAYRQVAVLELEGVLWSDWGREERITETLVRIGRRPAWESPRSAPERRPERTRLAVAGI